MASTTKTTNLELSQFVGTDKPAWLTDYNGDMQKIDNGYKKLEDANTATQADLDATKQDLSGSKTDIDGVKASVQALEAQDIAIGNRLTVVEGNYDTMHHEVAINTNDIETINKQFNAKLGINGIKYDMGIGDRVNNVRITKSGKESQHLAIVATKADNTNKYVNVYDYSKNAILPDFITNIKSISINKEVTVPANTGSGFEVTIPVDANVIGIINATSNDVEVFNYYLGAQGTSNATAHIFVKNKTSENITTTVYGVVLNAIKGVVVQ